MSPKEARIITVKFLNNEASVAELNQLSHWIEENPSNDVAFKEYLNIYHTLDKRQVFDAMQAYRKTEAIINAKQNRSKVFRLNIYKYAAAAVLVGVLLTAYLFKQDSIFGSDDMVTPVIVNNAIKPGANKAILTLEDGKEIVFEKGASLQTNNATSNGEKIIYEAHKGQALAYNTLTIPRGGQFFVKLSDGTQVWLNSESQLKYPVNFTEGESRKVELVYGEAYFDVSPSTEHKGASFEVINDNQLVHVLGTEFNVKAYNDEDEVYTTLVEGKVEISSSKEQHILKPGEQSRLNKNVNTLSVEAVDVYRQISWKEGIFSFKRMTLEDIMTILSRWYDMDVVFENEELKQRGFNGSLGKEQPIEQILENIKSFGVIKNYEIRNKQVILK
ncbi:FecR family protein [Aestuariibaculum lutulentum]|uniref:DUF4974 domain-containing protein n=1 Tax=Aestuariibaculum lutulentum TaxID=2920935 RepID=A0ABS9RKS0_9FLAO|nr:FecR family protein [Aestuariibaculum lutulentum]MCH4553106.1 DUF4974 domain-containing protein [Aestuariibaculum lutulentum]